MTCNGRFVGSSGKITRVVEPTSLLDSARVLADLGQCPGSYSTMKPTLRRVVAGGYRDPIAARCFAHATGHGDTSLVLYDVTSLYFEAEKEDDLRKVGYSKERWVDPQILVGLLVDRHGFALEVDCFEGNKAEKLSSSRPVRGGREVERDPCRASSPASFDSADLHGCVISLRNTAILILRLTGRDNIAAALRHHACDTERALTCALTC